MASSVVKVDNGEENLFAALVDRLRPGCKISSVEALVPDASTRRYFRLFLDDVDPATPSSVVAMVMDGLSGEEVAGSGEEITSDVAYITLTRFYRVNGITVPQIHLDAREDRVILLEDLGDNSLGQVLHEGKDKYSNTQLDIFFRMAVDQIVSIQKIYSSGELFAFRRRFTEEMFLSEAGEFGKYYLEPKFNPPSKNKQIFDKMLALLCGELASRPVVLSHRDYHAWNLHLDRHGKVRIIDFQDSLLAPATYDIACLLNDRGADSLLGESRYKMLLKYFLIQTKLGGSAMHEFNLCLLQRDLKVVGRFEKLATEQGYEEYRKWIPSTLVRIGQTLERMVAENNIVIYREALDYLKETIPEIAEGVNKPFHFEAF